jgi:hypothetical protein
MTRTPAELFAEIAICVVAWLAFFIGLYLVTPS